MLNDYCSGPIELEIEIIKKTGNRKNVVTKFCENTPQLEYFYHSSFYRQNPSNLFTWSFVDNSCIDFQKLVQTLMLHDTYC